MKVFGIDPGLNCAGFALLEMGSRPVPALLEGGIVRTKQTDPLGVRLSILHTQIRELLDSFQPDVMAMESLFSVYKHPRTAILMGHARGVILLAASLKGIQVIDYPPLKVKKSLTGNGRASKEQVQRMVQNQLGLSSLPSPADLADAIAVALCHCNVLRHNYTGASR